MTSGVIRPKAPCSRNAGKCDLRGTEVCHNDRCPYGWAEYEKKSREWRDSVLKARRLNEVTWRRRDGKGV